MATRCYFDDNNFKHPTLLESDEMASEAIPKEEEKAAVAVEAVIQNNKYRGRNTPNRSNIPSANIGRLAPSTENHSMLRTSRLLEQALA